VIRERDNELTGGLLPAAENAKWCGILSTAGTALGRKNFLLRGRGGNQKQSKWNLTPLFDGRANFSESRYTLSRQGDLAGRVAL
jgi:hypothetical protein